MRALRPSRTECKPELLVASLIECKVAGSIHGMAKIFQRFIFKSRDNDVSYMCLFSPCWNLLCFMGEMFMTGIFGNFASEMLPTEANIKKKHRVTCSSNYYLLPKAKCLANFKE